MFSDEKSLKGQDRQVYFLLHSSLNVVVSVFVELNDAGAGYVCCTVRVILTSIVHFCIIVQRGCPTSICWMYIIVPASSYKSADDF